LKTHTISPDLHEYLSTKLSFNDETVISLFQALEWSSNEPAFLEKVKELYNFEVKTLSNISTETSLQFKSRPSAIIVPFKKSLKYFASANDFKELCLAENRKTEKTKKFLKKANQQKFDSDEELDSEDSEQERKPTPILQLRSKKENMLEKLKAKDFACKEEFKSLQKEASSEEVFKKYEHVFEREREGLEEINEEFFNDEIVIENNFIANGEENQPIPVIERVGKDWI